MSTFKPFVNQVGGVSPFKVLREYDDHTEPLCYSTSVTGTWDGCKISQPIFVPSGTGKYPFEQSTVLTSAGYASIRGFKFRLRYLVDDDAIPVPFEMLVRMIISDTPPTTTVVTNKIPICERRFWMENKETQTDGTWVEKELTLPDVDRVFVPAGNNIYFCVMSRLADYEHAYQVAVIDASWFSALDDK